MVAAVLSGGDASALRENLWLDAGFGAASVPDETIISRSKGKDEGEQGASLTATAAQGQPVPVLAAGRKRPAVAASLAPFVDAEFQTETAPPPTSAPRRPREPSPSSRDDEWSDLARSLRAPWACERQDADSDAQSDADKENCQPASPPSNSPEADIFSPSHHVASLGERRQRSFVDRVLLPLAINVEDDAEDELSDCDEYRDENLADLLEAKINEPGGMYDFNVYEDL